MKKGDRIRFDCYYDYKNDWVIINHEFREGVYEDYIKYVGKDNFIYRKPKEVIIVKTDDGGSYHVPTERVISL